MAARAGPALSAVLQLWLPVLLAAKGSLIHIALLTVTLPKPKAPAYKSNGAGAVGLGLRTAVRENGTADAPRYGAGA